MINPGALNPHNYDLFDDIASNLRDLSFRLKEIERKWIDAGGKEFVITSGLRSTEDQERINPKAMQSKHLKGQAADIEDKDGKLAAWILQNLKHLEFTHLYIEDPAYTKGWVHFQIVPPHSGKRIFIP